MVDLEPLKALIAKYESKGDYDIVYLGIPERYRPDAHLGKPLTKCTIEEVLSWQAYVTSNQVGAVSSAAGKWQIIRKTLSEFAPKAGLTATDLFNTENQDRIFHALLVRRGLDEFLSGDLSQTDFANNLAREWAAMPVVSDIQGAHRPVTRGECFYSGDKVNKALVDPEALLEAIACIRPKAKGGADQREI